MVEVVEKNKSSVFAVSIYIYLLEETVHLSQVLSTFCSELAYIAFVDHNQLKLKYRCFQHHTV